MKVGGRDWAAVSLAFHRREVVAGCRSVSASYTCHLILLHLCSRITFDLELVSSFCAKVTVKRSFPIDRLRISMLDRARP